MGIACTAGSEQEQFWSGWWTELIFTTLHIHSYQYKNLLQYFSRSPFSLSLPPLSPTFPQVLPHSEFYCPTPRHPFLSFFMAHFIALSFSFSLSRTLSLSSSFYLRRSLIPFWVLPTCEERWYHIRIFPNPLQNTVSQHKSICFSVHFTFVKLLFVISIKPDTVTGLANIKLILYLF